MKPGNAAGELKRLITIGKEKGFLTYDELNNALPPDLVSSEQIDDMMTIFDEMNIQIVETVQMVKSNKKQDSKDEAEQEVEVPIEGEPEAKLTDPVKMYLREMGLVSLLTREGEVEIAKRIEEGEKEVIEAILETPMGVQEILDLGEQISRGDLRLKEAIKDADEDDSLAETEERQKEVLALIDDVRRFHQEKSFFLFNEKTDKEKDIEKIFKPRINKPIEPTSILGLGFFSRRQQLDETLSDNQVLAL